MINELRNGFETAYIDSSLASVPEYRPSFVSNNPSEGKKVISSIEEELLCCDKFQISVAFITMGGITPLLQTLKELEKKGIPGEILTTNYLNFSEPKALAKLNELKNITLKMFNVEDAETGFHTKGYIFKKEEIYRIILGSSNMTGAALTTNIEWNTKIISTSEGELACDVVKEFEDHWNSEYALDFDAFYETYKTRYEIIKHQQEEAKKDAIPSFEKYKLKPNSMQEEFIVNLRRILARGEKRALLISATGTGKTYASAFAVRELGFKRILFVVHRAQLAKQAKSSFENVFNNSVSMGIVGDGKHEYDKDFVFAMVETLNKDEHLFKYEKDAFDCIILDEAHHSPANTYQKIMAYFTPKLFLGMTATPDKRDDNIEGRNVYELFNHEIAHEIRLQRAMEDNLLCPFHYFGLSEIAVLDDEEKKSKELSETAFNKLTSEARVEHVIEQAKYYGYSGDRVKGLIFCSRNNECEKLSQMFNAKGFRTLALSNKTPQSLRETAFERLAMDEEDATDEMQPLDYIFSVDILNEGIDIVEVNQVIMLRPTQSPIVFIQQLGRGLRKAEGKDYVVILDFIGNYDNNFMIPIALSGDRTYNKDTIRRYVGEGNRVIPGASTIHFDEISKKRIYEAIDIANFNDIKLIKENYTNLKNKLGRIPSLMDFDKYGEMDVLRIFDNKALGSYYKFLVKYEDDYKVRLSETEEQIVEFISRKLANGKRVQELELLKRLLTYSKKQNEYQSDQGFSANVTRFRQYIEYYSTAYGKKIDSNQADNIINVLTNKFPTGASKATYDKCIFLEEDSDDYVIAEPFAKMLLESDFYEIVNELLDFGINRYRRDYSESYKNTDLVLYKKYTYEDACRLLNWETNEVPLNIGGYKYDSKTRTFPVFINYDKAEDISDTTKYEDHFTSSNTLIAISKQGRSLESDDVQNFINSKELGINVPLFVRKNKDDKISKEFYFLGYMYPSGQTKEFIMNNTDKSAVEIEWKLDVPVREDLYEYITG